MVGRVRSEVRKGLNKVGNKTNLHFNRLWSVTGLKSALPAHERGGWFLSLKNFNFQIYNKSLHSHLND